MQGRFCHLKEDGYLRFKALHLPHQLGADTASSTAHQHHFVGDDLTDIVGVNLDGGTLQKVLYLYGVDASDALCVCFVRVVKLGEVGGAEDVDVMVEEHLQVLSRCYLTHLYRRDDDAFYLVIFHPAEGLLVEWEDGEPIETII